MTSMRWAVAAAAMAILSACASAPQQAQDGDADAESQAPAGPEFLQLARSAAEEGRFSGVIVAMRGAETIRYHAGVADASWNVAMAPDARFELYSVSKTLAAVGVLESHERGVLDIDAPLSDAVAWWPDAWAGVTMRHLLAHRSGLPETGFSDLWTGSLSGTVEAFLDVEPTDISLISEPGAEFRYSNFAYAILAAALETIWERPYQDVLDALVLTPAGMTEAGSVRGAQANMFDLPMDFGPRGEGIRRQLLTSAGPLVVDRLVSGYDGAPDQLIHVDANAAASQGASGAYATAADMIRFLDALWVDQVLLEPDTLAMMRTPTSGGESGYGLGLNISVSEDGVRLFHTGGINGFQIHAGYYPDTDGAVIYMSNHGFAPFPQITSAMEAWVMDQGESASE